MTAAPGISAGAAEIEPEWIHLAYPATSALREVYGYAGRQGTVNLEGIRFRSPGRASSTLLIYMHPASTLQLLPVPRAMAAAGVDVLCAGSRYARNDTPLIMEMAALDLGAYVRHARETWGYAAVVLAGWSGAARCRCSTRASPSHRRQSPVPRRAIRSTCPACHPPTP